MNFIVSKLGNMLIGNCMLISGSVAVGVASLAHFTFLDKKEI